MLIILKYFINCLIENDVYIKIIKNNAYIYFSIYQQIYMSSKLCLFVSIVTCTVIEFLNKNDAFMDGIVLVT